MNILSHLPASRTRKPKRVGRGPGSGTGKTCGKGHKGQKSRSGPKIAPGFEGGQMPLNRRLPKRGFNNLFRKQIAVINLDDLEKAAQDDTLVDVRAWVKQGRIKRARDGVKVLGRGEITRALTVRAHFFSEAARDKILASGGTIEEIS